MTKKHSNNELSELKKKHHDVIKELLQLAQDRKKGDLAPWNDPENIQDLLDIAEKKAEESASHLTESKMLTTIIGNQYVTIFMHYFAQADELAKNEEIRDSVSSNLAVMTALERFFILYMSALQLQIDDLPDAAENYDQLKSVMVQVATQFQEMLSSLRAQHDGLMAISYQIKF